MKYEWGTLNTTEFLQKLAQEGITDAKVESLGGNVVVIHLVSFITFEVISARNENVDFIETEIWRKFNIDYFRGKKVNKA